MSTSSHNICASFGTSSFFSPYRNLLMRSHPEYIMVSSFSTGTRSKSLSDSSHEIGCRWRLPSDGFAQI